MVDVIVSMGFAAEQARAALEAFGGNVEAALDALLSGSAVPPLPLPPAPRPDGKPASGGWSCAFCTYENPLEVAVCAMCGGIPSDPVAPMAPAEEDDDDEDDEDEDERSTEDESSSPPLDGMPSPKRDKLEEPEGPTADEKAPEELRGAYARLKAFFLSPAASTDKQRTDHTKTVGGRMCTDAEITAMVRGAVPGIDRMLDRRHTTPVLAMMLSTHRSGLPLYEKMPAVQRHLVDGIRFTFAALRDKPQPVRARHLQRLADAFTSCQAEQVRVIDAVYGALSGRDAGLREQVLAIVDDQKQRVLDQVTHVLHPRAWRTDDASPTDQVPHIQSAYRKHVGRQLGLRAVEAASADYSSTPLSDAEKARVVELFARMFQIDELLATIVDDVNQQSPTADRLISRDDLCRWAGDTASNKGFVAHSVYYDEEHAADYGDTKPKPENEFQPFLSKRVALDVLNKLFL
jgi:hypothetical protein